jgi:hypothetical protein
MKEDGVTGTIHLADNLAVLQDIRAPAEQASSSLPR